MKESLASWVTVAVAVILGGGGMAWLFAVPSAPVERRDDKGGMIQAATNAPVSEKVDIRGKFQKFDGKPSAVKAAWPSFRGPRLNNISPETTRLRDNWDTMPPVLWSVDLGEGYAGPAVRNGCVYVLDYDEKLQGDSLRCFSLDDGKEIWRRWYKVRVKRNHGMSRTVPAVTDRFVVTVGPRCHVLCADAASGDFRWGIDMVEQFGTKEPLWYTGQCPLIDGDVAVLAPGGSSLLIGVACDSGTILWKTPNPDGWQMSHSSVMPMTIAGRKMYVYCAIGGVAGIAADGPDRGAVLWKTSAWKHSVVAGSPVDLGDGRLFLTTGYGAGSMMLKVEEKGGQFAAAVLYSLDKSAFACEQQTPIYARDCLFTVMPNDGGALKRELVCMRPDGKFVWASGKEHRFGLGPFMIADDKFFVLDDEGVLTVAKVSADAYAHLGTVKVLDGRDAWGPLAIVEGRLLLRDLKRMICLDARAQGPVALADGGTAKEPLRR
jgi:outer membrane protein assembly factor BamB